MNNQELIIVKQLPKIEEHLKDLSIKIDEKVNCAKTLVCTEENVKTIKQVRADLNKEFNDIEKQRKIVKEKVLAPYKQFEEVYKMYVSEKYKTADTDLKTKIDNIENELKAQKEQEIKDYFEEYKTSKNIDFVTFKQANINITLTASKKALKEQVKKFIDEIVDDLKLIETQDYKEEILVEYKQTLNISRAIQDVVNRHKLLEEEKRKQEEKLKEQEELSKLTNANIPSTAQEILAKPTVELKQDEILILKFTVRGTKTKLKELKKILEDGGYDYE